MGRGFLFVDDQCSSLQQSHNRPIFARAQANPSSPAQISLQSGAGSSQQSLRRIAAQVTTAQIAVTHPSASSHPMVSAAPIQTTVAMLSDKAIQ